MNVGQMIAALQSFDPEMPVTIQDADTQWYLAPTVETKVVEVVGVNGRVNAGILILSGDYDRIEGEASEYAPWLETIK